MSDRFYQKIAGNNINFLIGSGMSTPLYKTLALPTDVEFSFEDVLTHKCLTEDSKIILYIYYYSSIINKTTEQIDIENIIDKPKNELADEQKVVYHYFLLVKWLAEYLANASVDHPKRINIFTTNYDLLFEQMFDYTLHDMPLLWFNDGSRGFFQRIINSENYNINILHSGFNDNYRRELSMVNLYKLHGSVLWKYSDNKEYILLDERFALFDNINKKIDDSIQKTVSNRLESLHSIGLDEYVKELNDKNVENNSNGIDNNLLKDFYELYRMIPIVSPNKGKFEETVFNQHYYQLLRAFSYELEKKQTTLIVFGFSFADEHIRSIVKRSLLNLELQVFIIPYSERGYLSMKGYFSGYNNVHFLPDFSTEDKAIKGNFEYLLRVLGAD
ncbi:MAG: SIR2 family protein [Veillonella parvula]|uniref:SIR2 family protein n=1 Tax=Veillonella parvula TaxID=29466 RepID=UPI0039942714